MELVIVNGGFLLHESSITIGIYHYAKFSTASSRALLIPTGSMIAAIIPVLLEYRTAPNPEVFGYRMPV